jgi:hypothetical protein
MGLIARKESLIHVEKAAVWVLELVGMFWKRGKSLIPAWGAEHLVMELVLPLLKHKLSTRWLSDTDFLGRK